MYKYLMTYTVGFATVQPGQIFQESLFFGSDPGPQWIVANPISPGGLIRTDNFLKRLEPGGGVTYFINFTNVGNVPTNVNFQGGGLT